MRTSIWFAGLAFLGAAVCAPGGTFYVADVGGDDGNDGTNWVTALKTINAAIAKCGNTVDDTIWVSNGTYTAATTGGDIVLVNKARVTIEGVNGKENTFIDGGYPAVSNRCVNVTGTGAGADDVTLRGITIRNGYWTAPMLPDKGGAGIYAASSSDRLLVDQCNIVSNTIYGGQYGAAVRWDGGANGVNNCILRDCTIAGNDADGLTATRAIVMRCRLENCVVVNNLCRSSAILNECIAYDSVVSSNTVWSSSNQGGGFFLPNAANTATFTNEVVNCTITHNSTVGSQSYGGGICVPGNATASIRQCVIAGNGAEDNGGGIYVLPNGSAVLENCTVVANHYTGADADYAGGGVAVRDATASLSLINTIVYHNKLDGDVNAGKANFWVDAITAVTNCCATTNALGGGTLPGLNNVTAEPQFTALGSGYGTNWTGGDLTLTSTSPCKDQGTNLPWNLLPGATDLAGNDRIVNTTVDIGAYEYFVTYVAPKGTIIFIK